MSGSVEEIIMKRRVKERTDLISDLPPHILHHILSCISFKDSVRTSVLSKRLNSIQKSFPILKFKTPHDFLTPSTRRKERLIEYVDFVDGSLQRFVLDNLSIKRMDLDLICVERDSVPLVNTWLPLILHRGVSDLRFDVSINEQDYDRYYPLPETSFTVNSSLLFGSSKFFHLQKLELSIVRLSEKIIQDIIRNCPNLTDLNISYFYGLKTLNISKPDKLASLTISVPDLSTELTGIFVDALSLQRFSLHFFRDYPVFEIDLSSCRNLRKFELTNSAITDAEFNTIISRLPLLEDLKIALCHMVRRIWISLQKLKRLELEFCDLESVEMDVPILSEFFLTISEESGGLPILLLANPIPGFMNLTYNFDFEDEHINSFWFLRIREYLTVPFKHIILDLGLGDTINFQFTQISFDPYELRERVIPPPVEIDCLDLTCCSDEYSSYWEPLLNGILWSCLPKEVLMSINCSVHDNCAKTLCRIFNKSECQLCSNLSHCKCWRRHFKAAMIKCTGDIRFDYLNVSSITEDVFSNQVFCSVRVMFEWDRSV